jgi:hypothetical protein
VTWTGAASDGTSAPAGAATRNGMTTAVAITAAEVRTRICFPSKDDELNRKRKISREPMSAHRLLFGYVC